MLRRLHANYGADITYDDMLDMVDRGMAGPTRLLVDTGRVVGRALATLCTFFNPSALVLEAGGPRANAAVIQGVSEQIEQSAPPFVRRGLSVRPSTLGDDAALCGAVRAARAAILAS